MKAVITQITKGKAVLLTQDGGFLRVPDRGYRVGQRIAVPRKKRRPLRSLLAAACLLACGFMATAYAAENLPFSYVSVDVNPSVQMTLNWYNRVRSIRAVNEDAQAVVSELSQNGIVNQPIDSAMQMIYSALEEDAYLTEEADNDVVIAVASYGLKDVAALQEQLQDMQTVADSGTTLSVKTVQVDAGTLAEAEAYHTTAGRLALAKTIADGDGAAAQEWLQKPVHDMLGAAESKTSEAGGLQNGAEPPEGGPPQGGTEAQALPDGTAQPQANPGLCPESAVPQTTAGPSLENVDPQAAANAEDEPPARRDGAAVQPPSGETAAVQAPDEADNTETPVSPAETPSPGSADSAVPAAPAPPDGTGAPPSAPNAAEIP